jgi:hypothetical protein
MSYVVTGLPPERFAALFGLSDAELAARGIERRRVDAPTGFPCRVSLEDAQVGETVLLLNYEHQPAPTPFRASHAIYVNERAHEMRRCVGELPGALARRTHISLRAFDRLDMMLDAEVCAGAELEAAIARLFGRADVAYLHAHAAGMGCYLARIDRP